MRLNALVGGSAEVVGPETTLRGAAVAMVAASVGAVAVIARLKGRGSLRVDYGLRISSRDGGWLAVGVALQIGLSIVLLPIAWLADLDDAPQEAVRRIEDAGGLALVLLALGVVVVAPIVEELLFRGLLLRALLRRMTHGWAVLIDALAFGAVHLSDPGAAVVVPGLVALGVVAGVQAVKTESLSRPILLHAGFNLLTVVFLVAGG